MIVIEDDLSKDYVKFSTQEHVETAQMALDSIESIDPNWAELPDMKSRFSEQKKQYDYNFEKDQISEKLEYLEGIIKRLKNKDEFPETYCKNLGVAQRSKYDSLNTRFKSSQLDEPELKSRLDRVGQFYDSQYQIVLDQIQRQFNNAITPSNMWRKGYRGSDEFFEEFREKQRPKKEIEALGKTIGFVEDAMDVIPAQKAILSNYFDSLTNRKKDLEALIDSQEMLDLDAQAHQIKIDKVIPYKNVKSDASIVSAVKQDYEKEFGTIVKVIIVDSEWQIHKLYNGRIDSKSISIQYVAKTEDGRCHLVNGNVSREYYEGSYGKAELVGESYPEEMNCNNTNKSKPKK